MTYQDAITGADTRARDSLVAAMREPTMPLRTRAEVDDEIASENRAISRIEEGIDNYVPPRCSFCTASAMDTCPLCERPMCFDDAHPSTNVCVECWSEMP